MAQATFSIRMDENLKKEFDALCVEFGMNSTTAFNVFARAVVREGRIPFEIAKISKENSMQVEKKAFYASRKQTEKNDLSDLLLDDSIDEPNETTYKAMQEAENMLVDPKAKRFSSVEELFEELNS